MPAAAAIYAEDAYVDRAFSEETAALVPSMRPWVTNEYEHNGLRAGGDRILTGCSGWPAAGCDRVDPGLSSG